MEAGLYLVEQKTCVIHVTNGTYTKAMADMKSAVEKKAT